MNLPTLRDELIHDFLQAVYGKGLHPEDAAIAIGVPIESFIALRKEHPAVNAAWFMADEKEKGLLKKPRTVLELKHDMSFKIWRRFEPRLLGMIDRIPLESDDPEVMEKADAKVMDLLRHKIISETLPRESYGQLDQNVVVTKDPFEDKSEEELLAIVEKRVGMALSLKATVEKAAEIRERLATGRVIDVDYTVSNSGTPEGNGRTAGEVRGQPVLSVPLDSAPVGGDDDREEDDGDLRGEPVQREDDV